MSTLLAVTLALVTVNNVLAITQVNECSGHSSGKRLEVNIHGCEAPPCVLKKNTNATVEIRFVPVQKVEKLVNRVFARVIFPLPFVGVDGESSCDSIYLPTGGKAGCPVDAGTEYLYKQSFEIHSYYPSISPTVHWALLDSDSGESVVCFEVKSSIQS
ncbi:ecdysteroid-regulated 16 kDa protein-like [Macrosteles quadrilineatus]|uniref:ecdysteroid-regulated 16 kDa protein-like n=1 Tax=Macrosteles quadrilineatus TaxID=74068 RepID=UPI0023E321CC|nr:ecdysteroid-regulated 16 kDa protein-like [Macrosteles quadrilineatus]